MSTTQVRAGLLIRGHRGPPEVRGALVRFARWARRTYDFPIRVPVYLSGRERLLTREGVWVTASFFAPLSREVEPFIRIATGDFQALKEEEGLHGALAAYIHSLCHELVHYQQWVATGRTTERGVLVRAGNMPQSYVDFARVP